MSAPGASPPILYSFRRCPYAMRARLALASSGQTCELREVVLRNKPASMLQASPKGTVPVLIAHGEVIDQSLDIMLWALRRDDPEGWLTPTRGDLPAMLALIGQCDGAFKQQLDRYKYPQRYGASTGEDQRDLAVPWLHMLDERLQETGWFFGSRCALADMAIVPFVRQFAHVDAQWFAAQSWAALQGWLANWKDSGRYTRIMHKYPAWQEGDAAVMFPPPA